MKMNSKLLKDSGLISYISGSQYHMRAMSIGEKVADEVKKILKTMGEDPGEIYSGQQVHGTNIEYCDGKSGREFFYGRHFLETDGLITDKKDIALVIKFADCSPIILFDPVRGVQCAIHSGWRGTAKKFSKIALDRMVNDFGSKIEDILAYIGPSIDIDSYEVGKEVYQAFEDFPTRDKFFKEHGDKYLLSMVDANLEVLLEAGLKEDQIEVCRESTFKNKNLNSARRDGEGYKLNAIFTIMK